MGWLAYQYQVEITGDGSPSLRSLAIPTQESMHHRGGAFTETQLIYGEPLRARFDQGHRRVLSVGLGLGYNELMTACEALKRGLSAADLFLVSYESEDILKQSFLDFLILENLTDEKNQTYQTILNFFLKDSRLEAQAVKKFLIEMKELGTWRLLGKFEPSTLIPEKFNLIIYDAFSAKTTPELWSEQFLDLVWKANASANCSVATYACRADLRKTLKANGFNVVEDVGFQGTRKRTLALRDI